jgi:hypothetical protein
MSETPQEYLSRKLQVKVQEPKKESKVKEPNCINMPPNVWAGIDQFCKEYYEKNFIKMSRNMAIEMACKELLTKYSIKW